MDASPFLPLPLSLEIEGICVGTTALTVQVRSTARTALCPLCQQQARRIHNHYQRTVADLPCGSSQVVLVLTVCQRQ